jgi:hypothetical protein
MSATERISIGDPMPRIAEIVARDPFTVAVTWAGGVGKGKTTVVDLAPLVLSRKIFAPLRNDVTLFKTAHLVEDGAAVAWGEDEQIDVAATTIEALANEIMTSAEFAEFLRRHSFSLDAAAAQLGISRRLAAYYAKGRQIPRYIALACAYLDEAQSRNAIDGPRARSGRFASKASRRQGEQR